MNSLANPEHRSSPLCPRCQDAMQKRADMSMEGGYRYVCASCGFFISLNLGELLLALDARPDEPLTETLKVLGLLGYTIRRYADGIHISMPPRREEWELTGILPTTSRELHAVLNELALKQAGTILIPTKPTEEPLRCPKCGSTVLAREVRCQWCGAQLK